MRECTGEFNMVDVKFCVSFVNSTVGLYLSVFLLHRLTRLGMHLASFYRQ